MNYTDKLEQTQVEGIPSAYQLPPCPDCGINAGMPHAPECDIERCSVCQCQRLTCGCVGHDPSFAVWTGRFPVNKNAEISLALSRDKRLRPKVGHCYRNCFRAIQVLPEFKNAIYVEGIVHLTRGFQIEHAWLERDGEIVDPTLPTQQGVYFSGLRFNGVVGLAEAMAIPKQSGSRDLPLFHRFGFGGHLSPEFTAARIAAKRMLEFEMGQPSGS